MNTINIKDRCHVNTNDEGDNFVGIKADTNGAHVFFPIGYQLSETDIGIRRDIKNLIHILKEYTNKKERVFQSTKNELKDFVEFPINSYQEVINYYLNYNYYVEKDCLYKVSSRGKIDWGKTIKKQKPLVQQDGSFIYTQTITKIFPQNDNKLITKIHKYCVYECFDKIGWLYMVSMPPKPDIKFNKALFINELMSKLSDTYNDRERILFKSMIDMINFMDEKANANCFYFGTDRFEYVWEKLIDRVFGENNKERYFPKAEWKLRYGRNQESSALQPDTIMVYDDKVYVLDAKYYRYGVTGFPMHLPNSSSINKQITYGEYIDTYMNIKDENIFNAFIMPFNKDDNVFDTKKIFENIGEATGKWRMNRTKNYDRVQGIVIDIRYLMYHGFRKSSENIEHLATIIETGISTPV